MRLINLLKKKDETSFNAGRVQTGDKYFHCLDCDYVWPGPCHSPCKRCRGMNVTQCSEIAYPDQNEATAFIPSPSPPSRGKPAD